MNPFDRQKSFPLVYLIRPGEEDLYESLSAWIQLVRLDGTVERFYEHWILGRIAIPHEPRWSVIRDVLGWVE